MKRLQNLRKSAILCLATLALSACGNGERPVVRVPVRVACVNPADIPAPVPPAGEIPEDARQAADLLGSIVIQLRNSDRELRALLSGCTT